MIIEEKLKKSKTIQDKNEKLKKIKKNTNEFKP